MIGETLMSVTLCAFRILGQTDKYKWQAIFIYTSHILIALET